MLLQTDLRAARRIRHVEHAGAEDRKVQSIVPLVEGVALWQAVTAAAAAGHRGQGGTTPAAKSISLHFVWAGKYHPGERKQIFSFFKLIQTLRI